MALFGLIVAVTCRRRALAVIGVFLVAATVATQVRWYYFGRAPHLDQYTELRVLSSNIYKGRADATEFVELAKGNADVVTVAELTPEAVQRFQQADIDEEFPYSLLKPAPGAGGIGMWSRYPISPVSAPRHRNATMPAARVEVPGLEFKPLVASVHIMSPVAGQLENFAREAGKGAVIVGGDYNSTPDMRQFRDLLTDGYRDAVEQTGSGFAPTFKADGWLPPVITIDHVLTRNAIASSIKTITITGSDHRALLATVRIPREPAA